MRVPTGTCLNRIMIIGLTGGIGTGKSTVSEYLINEYGFEIVDADKISREIVEKGSPLLDVISDTFGSQFIDEDGNLKRRELGAYVFADKSRKEQLDSIMMGEIISIIRKRIRMHDRVILDAALLFEAGLDKDTDVTWLVDADTDVRIKRVCSRDGISEQEVRDRISNQMNQDEKKKYADVVIDNSGTKEELHRQIDEVIREYV